MYMTLSYDYDRNSTLVFELHDTIDAAVEEARECNRLGANTAVVNLQRKETFTLLMRAITISTLGDHSDCLDKPIQRFIDNDYQLFLHLSEHYGMDTEDYPEPPLATDIPESPLDANIPF